MKRRSGELCSKLHQPPVVNERLDITGLVNRVAGNLVATTGGAGLLERLFNRFPGFAGALLNSADQFVRLAFDELEIVIRELRPFLFQFALGDVPVAFDFECCHIRLFCFGYLLLFAVNMTTKFYGLTGPTHGRGQSSTAWLNLYRRDQTTTMGAAAEVEDTGKHGREK